VTEGGVILPRPYGSQEADVHPGGDGPFRQGLLCGPGHGVVAERRQYTPVDDAFIAAPAVVGGEGDQRLLFIIVPEESDPEGAGIGPGTVTDETPSGALQFFHGHGNHHRRLLYPKGYG